MVADFLCRKTLLSSALSQVRAQISTHSDGNFGLTVTCSSTRARLSLTPPRRRPQPWPALQCRLQAEGREQLRAGRRDLRDDAGLHPHDVELDRTELTVAGPLQVARGGRHPVGPDRDQAPDAH